MNRRYETSIGWCLFYLALDVVITFEVAAIIIFSSDLLGIVPNGASHTESIIFAIALYICTELWSLKYGQFGAFGSWVERQRQERDELKDELRARRERMR